MAAASAQEDDGSSRRSFGAGSFFIRPGGQSLLAFVDSITAQGCYEALDEAGSTFMCYCYRIEAERGLQRWYVFRRYREFESLVKVIPKALVLPALPRKHSMTLQLNPHSAGGMQKVRQRYDGLLSWLQALLRELQNQRPSPAVAACMTQPAWELFERAFVSFLLDGRDQPPKASGPCVLRGAGEDSHAPPTEVVRLIAVAGQSSQVGLSGLHEAATSELASDTGETHSLAPNDHGSSVGHRDRDLDFHLPRISESVEDFAQAADNRNDSELTQGCCLLIKEASAPWRSMCMAHGDNGFGPGKVCFDEKGETAKWRLRSLVGTLPAFPSVSRQSDSEVSSSSVAGVQLYSHAWASKARRVAAQIERKWLDGQVLTDEILDQLIDGTFGQPPRHWAAQSMTIALEAGVPYKPPRNSRWTCRHRPYIDSNGRAVGCCRMGYNHPSGNIECTALSPPEYPPHTLAPWYKKAMKSGSPSWVHYVDEVLCLSYVVPLRWHHAFAGTVSLDFAVSATSAAMGVAQASVPQQIPENSHASIDEVLRAPLRDAVRQLEQAQQLPDEHILRKTLQNIIRSNRLISGACIAFEAGVWREELTCFSIYACKRASSLSRDAVEFSELTYNYHDEVWYHSAITQGGFCWSEPYFDEGGGEVWMKTLSSPFCVAGEVFAGVVSLDVSFDASLQAFFYPPDLEAPRGRCEACSTPVGDRHWIHHVDQHVVCIRCMARSLQPAEHGYEEVAVDDCCGDPGDDASGETSAQQDVTALLEAGRVYAQFEHATSSRLLSMCLTDSQAGAAHELRLQPEEAEDSALAGSSETWFSMHRSEGAWVVESVAWKSRLSAAPKVVLAAVGNPPNPEGEQVDFATGVAQRLVRDLAAMPAAAQDKASADIARVLAPFGKAAPQRVQAAGKAGIVNTVLSWPPAAGKWQALQELLKLGVAVPTHLSASILEATPLPIFVAISRQMALPAPPSLVLSVVKRHCRSAEDLALLAELCKPQAANMLWPWSERAALTDHVSLEVAAALCLQGSANLGSERFASLFSKGIALGASRPEGCCALELASKLSTLPLVRAEVPRLLRSLANGMHPNLGQPTTLSAVLSVLTSLAFPRERPVCHEVVLYLPKLTDHVPNAGLWLQLEPSLMTDVLSAGPSLWKDCLSLVSRAFRRAAYNEVTLQALRLLRRYALHGALPTEGMEQAAEVCLELLAFDQGTGNQAHGEGDMSIVKEEACFLLHDIFNLHIHTACLWSFQATNGAKAAWTTYKNASKVINLSKATLALKAASLPAVAVESLAALCVRLTLDMDGSSHLEVRRLVARTVLLENTEMLNVLKEMEADIAALQSALGESDLMLDSSTGTMHIIGAIRARMVADDVPLHVVCDMAAATGVVQAMLATLERLRGCSSPQVTAAAEHCYAVLVTMAHSCTEEARRRLQRRLMKHFAIFLADLNLCGGSAARLCVELLVESEVVHEEALHGFVMACLRLLRQRPQAVLLRALRVLLDKRAKELRNKRLEVVMALCGDDSVMGMLSKCKSREQLRLALQKGQARYELSLIETLAACMTDEVNVLSSGAAELHDGRCKELLQKVFPLNDLACLVAAAGSMRSKSTLLDFLAKLHGPGAATPVLLKDFATSVRRLLSSPSATRSLGGADAAASCVDEDSHVVSSDEETTAACSTGQAASVRARAVPSTAASSVNEWVGAASSSPVEANSFIADLVLPHFYAWLEHADCLLRRALTSTPPELDEEVELIDATRQAAAGIYAVVQDKRATAALGAQGVVTPSLLADILHRCSQLHLLDQRQSVDHPLQSLRRALTGMVTEGGGATESTSRTPDQIATALSKVERSTLVGTAGSVAPKAMLGDAEVMQQLSWALLRLHSRRRSRCQWTAANSTKLSVQLLRLLSLSTCRDVPSLARLLVAVLSTTKSKAVLLAALELGNSLLQNDTETVQQAVLRQASLAGGAEKAMVNLSSALLVGKLEVAEAVGDPALKQWLPKRDAWRLSFQAALFMQQLCEGHCEEWQSRFAAVPAIASSDSVSPVSACADFLRSQLQPGSSTLMGLLYWDCYFTIDALQQALGAIIQAFRCLTELCQGPHKANQAYLSSTTSGISDVVTCVWYALLNADRKRGFASYGAWDSARYAITKKLQISMVEMLLSLLEGGSFSAHVRDMAANLAAHVDWSLLQELLVQYGSLSGRQARDYVSTLMPRYLVLIETLGNIVGRAGKTSFAALCSSKAIMQDKRSNTSVGCCEVLNASGELELLHFPIPDVAQSHARNVGFQESLRRLHWEVPRDNPMQRVQFFIERAAGEAVWELIHSSRNPLLMWRSEVFAISFWFAVFLNISCVILDSSLVTITVGMDVWKRLEDCVYVVGIAQVALAAFRLMSCFASAVHSLGGANRLTRIAANFADFYLWYQLGYVVTSILALSDRHYYFFHLFDMCERQALLAGTLQSLRTYIPSLASAGALWLTIMYTYAIIGHMYFPEDFPEKECSSMPSCLLFVLNFGLRAGGGIGDILQGSSGEHRGAGRFTFDVSFFVVSTVVMSNIVSGIIIDAFSESREHRKEILEDERSRCFICSIEAARFDRMDRLGGGFASHCSGRHSVTQYCLLLAHLRLQDPRERSGTEDFVQQCLEERRCDFMPVHIASLPSGSVIRQEEEDAGAD